MTPQEKEDLEYQVKLNAQVALDKAKKLWKNPLVQFGVGFVAADLFLRPRGK